MKFIKIKIFLFLVCLSSIVCIDYFWRQAAYQEYLMTQDSMVRDNININTDKNKIGYYRH